MRTTTLLDSNTAASLLRTVAELCRHKQSAAVLVAMPDFLPEKQSAKDIEIWSMLGPYLRLTTLPDEPRVADRYFERPIDTSNVQVRN